jgi:hypothetical protein
MILLPQLLGAGNIGEHHHAWFPTDIFALMFVYAKVLILFTFGVSLLKIGL